VDSENSHSEAMSFGAAETSDKHLSPSAASRDGSSGEGIGGFGSRAGARGGYKKSAIRGKRDEDTGASRLRTLIPAVPTNNNTPNELLRSNDGDEYAPVQPKPSSGGAPADAAPPDSGAPRQPTPAGTDVSVHQLGSHHEQYDASNRRTWTQNGVTYRFSDHQANHPLSEFVNTLPKIVHHGTHAETNNSRYEPPRTQLETTGASYRGITSSHLQTRAGGLSNAFEARRPPSIPDAISQPQSDVRGYGSGARGPPSGLGDVLSSKDRPSDLQRGSGATAYGNVPHYLQPSPGGASYDDTPPYAQHASG
jgi:hypothetical protein